MEIIARGQMLWGGWFPLMVSSPHFRLTRVEELPGDEELVKVEFEFEPDGLTGGAAPARSGMVVLDPKRYWLIREAKTKASGVYGQGALSVTNEYSESFDGELPVPFVSRSAIRMVIPKHDQLDGKRFQSDFLSEIDLRSAPELNEEQFTLSAYGFSEPAFSRPSRARLWLFCITIALLASCVALLAYRHRRRERHP